MIIKILTYKLKDVLQCYRDCYHFVEVSANVITCIKIENSIIPTIKITPEITLQMAHLLAVFSVACDCGYSPR